MLMKSKHQTVAPPVWSQGCFNGIIWVFIEPLKKQCGSFEIRLYLLYLILEFSSCGLHQSFIQPSQNVPF